MLCSDSGIQQSQVKAVIGKGFIRGKNRAQTYLSSAVWAAMRFRRLLSARGQPERLKNSRKTPGRKHRGRKI